MSKPALWTRTRKGKAQLARAAKAKAAKREKKAVARRTAPRKRIAARSDRMRKRNAEYRLIREQFLREHPWCEACSQIYGLTGKRGLHPANDVHHRQGRAASLLTDVSKFLSVCRTAHIWIDANRDKARELGLLCKRGDWNKQPND